MRSRAGLAMCAFAALASAAELSVTRILTCLLCHTWSAFCANMLLLVLFEAWQLSVFQLHQSLHNDWILQTHIKAHMLAML